MIQVQARGMASTGGDYRFLGPQPQRWWEHDPASPYMRWESAAILVDSNAGGWRAVVFGLDAHLDSSRRQTQIMLAFSGRDGQDTADAELLLRLLASMLGGDDAAATALRAEFPVDRIEKLRGLSALNPDKSLPETAHDAHHEAEEGARRALETLPGVTVLPWARPAAAVAAHVDTPGAGEEFLSVVAALCRGTTGRAVLSASITNRDAAREVLNELAVLPGLSYVLADRKAGWFGRFESQPTTAPTAQTSKKKLQDQETSALAWAAVAIFAVPLLIRLLWRRWTTPREH